MQKRITILLRVDPRVRPHMHSYKPAARSSFVQMHS